MFRRWLMAAAMLVAAFAGGAFCQWLLVGSEVAHAAEAGGAGPGATQVRAECFVLVDAEGKELGRLGATEDGELYGLTLRDKTGEDVLLVLARGDKGVGLGLDPKKGKVRFGLGLTLDGENGGLDLTDSKGNTCLGMGTGPEGTGFALLDANGTKRAGLGMPPDGKAGFTVTDEEGRTIWQAP